MLVGKATPALAPGWIKDPIGDGQTSYWAGPVGFPTGLDTSPLSSVDVKWVAPVAGDDPVDHPPHYTAHPSGIECIQITEHMNFNLGNATKYIWRADLKHDAIEDLKKARWYLDREIARREAAA